MKAANVENSILWIPTVITSRAFLQECCQCYYINLRIIPFAAGAMSQVYASSIHFEEAPFYLS